MDKQHEDSRRQFEEWFNDEMVLHISASNETVVRLMWKAWQASRAAIVVELPEGMTTREALDLGFMGDYAAGVDNGIEETAKVIRSIGLSIKGE